MEEQKKCRVQVKERDDKIYVHMKGYCDPQNPNKKINKQYEVEL